MKKYIFTFLILTLCYSQHFELTIEESGESSLFIFQDSISSLNLGDEIGVFDSNGVLFDCVPTSFGGDCNPATETQYGEVLVGAGVWDGFQLNITSVVSVDQSAIGGPVLNGAVEGNPVVVKVYKRSEDMELAATLTWGAGVGNFGDIIQSVSEITPEDPFVCYDNDSLVSPFTCATALIFLWNIIELDNNFSFKNLIKIDLLRVVYLSFVELNVAKSKSQILL